MYVAYLNNYLGQNDRIDELTYQRYRTKFKAFCLGENPEQRPPHD